MSIVEVVGGDEEDDKNDDAVSYRETESSLMTCPCLAAPGSCIQVLPYTKGTA